MYTGLEVVDERQKADFLNMVSREIITNTGYNPADYQAFYGATQAEFAQQNHRTYGFSIGREAGVDLAALYMLGRGYSLDTVFGEGQDPEVIARKRQVGTAFLNRLDNEIPAAAAQPMSPDLARRVAERKAQREAEGLEPKEFSMAEYLVQRDMYESFFDALPTLKEEMERLTERIDFMDPKALDTPDGKRLLRLSAFTYDVFQELTRGESAAMAREDAISEYNRLHPEEQPPMSYDKLTDFASFATIARVKCNYDRAVNEVLTKGLNTDTLCQVVDQGMTLQMTMEIYRENKRKNPNGDAYTLFKANDSIDRIYSFPAQNARSEMYTPALTAIQNGIGEKAFVNSLLSGEFLKNFSLPEVDGEFPKGYLFGSEIDIASGEIRMPDDALSLPEKYLKQYSGIVDIEERNTYYELESDTLFRSLTGERKSDYLKGTRDFRYSLERSAATSILVCSLLNAGLTMDEITNPQEKVAEKRAAAAILKEKITDHGYSMNSPEYRAQQQALDAYVIDTYTEAVQKLKLAVQEANNNEDFYLHPEKIHSSKSGLEQLMLSEIAFDLSQELTKERQKAAVAARDPELPMKIENLGSGMERFHAFAQLRVGAKKALSEEANTDAIAFAIQAKLKNDIFPRMTNNDPNFDYSNFPGRDPEVEKVYTLQGKAESFYQNTLEAFVEKLYSREELSRKLADGSIVNSMKIEIVNGEVQSMTILGLTADKNGVVKDENGVVLTNDLSPEVKERYISEVRRLAEALNRTDSTYLDSNKKHIFIKGNTREFTDTKEKMNALAERLTTANLDFQSLRRELKAVDRAAYAYQDSHKGELNSRQKDRLAIMDQISELYLMANKRVQYPDSIEYRSKACRKIRKERFDLENKRLPADPTGMDLLTQRTKESYGRLYQLLVAGREPKGDEKKTFTRDMKTVALYEFTRVEKNVMGDEGRIRQIVNEHAGRLEELIDRSTYGNIRSLQNPTLKDLDKLFGEGHLRNMIDKAVNRNRRKAIEEKRKQNPVKRNDAPKRGSERNL